MRPQGALERYVFSTPSWTVAHDDDEPDEPSTFSAEDVWSSVKSLQTFLFGKSIRNNAIPLRTLALADVLLRFLRSKPRGDMISDLKNLTAEAEQLVDGPEEVSERPEEVVVGPGERISNGLGDNILGGAGRGASAMENSRLDGRQRRTASNGVRTAIEAASAAHRSDVDFAEAGLRVSSQRDGNLGEHGGHNTLTTRRPRGPHGHRGLLSRIEEDDSEVQGPPARGRSRSRSRDQGERISPRRANSRQRLPSQPLQITSFKGTSYK